MNSSLILKSINQLYQERFFIPSYQRGYRWTESQVMQLLDDIWHFAQNPPKEEDGKEKPFYCLQPIVVKKRDNDWEVIDGQQRLTTIDLIIHYFNEMWVGKSKIKTPQISYETRTDSEAYINNIEIANSDDIIEVTKFADNKKDFDRIEEFNRLSDKIIVKSSNFECDSNIDFFHISNAYKAIHYWVLGQGDFDYNKLQSVFLNETKVIWYEVQESENNKVVDIFTRLNIGKIPLTNSELIKAMFLMKDNFAKETVSLKQIQIATEWDLIERTLQNNDFWYFIYNPSNPIKYDTRIEFIFDLMSGKQKYSDFYSTFFHFFKKIEDKSNSIDSIWLEIKQYFLKFEEWYNDFELYHRIGYLIDCNYQITNLVSKSSNQTKNDFKDFLKSEMSKQIRNKDNKIIDFEDLDFDHNKAIIKKILLLFNVETILQSEKQDTRFPFYKYKDQNWDIEHVDSLADKKISHEAKRREWLRDMLEFFGNNPNGEQYGMLEKLSNSPKILDEEFDKTFDAIKQYFRDKDDEEKNKISNLALLDAETNRSYQNSFFPIKRNRIIKNDERGIFVPIATKNLFLKYYSKSAKDLIYWTKEDASNYMNALKNTLKDYLK